MTLAAYDGSRLLDALIVATPFIIWGVVRLIIWEWNRD